jgi:hypothetical protein
MPFALTWGFDRAIGLTVPLSPYGTGGTGVVGTAPPAGSVIISDVSGTTQITLQEDTDSPTIERGVQCTAQHKFSGSYDDINTLVNMIGMGLIVIDSNNFIWRVLTCTSQSMDATGGKLITVSESLSFDTPPDEFQVNTVDLGIDIIKHPRYFPNLYPTTDEFGTFVGQVKEAIIRAIQAYRDTPFFPSASNLYGLLNGQIQNIQVSSLANGGWIISVPNPNFNPKINYQEDTTIQDGNGVVTPPPKATANGQVNDQSIPVSVDATALDDPSIQLARAAAQEIITKLWRMEDSPYIAGIELKWSQYFFLPPLFNLGSFLEDPTFIVPDYFLQPDRPITELPPRGGISYPVAGDDNIFKFNAQANPQDYSSNGNSDGATVISWLRKADEIQYERTWFKITATWVGSAIGYFDTQLYGRFNRPSSPSDYQTFS